VKNRQTIIRTLKITASVIASSLTILFVGFSSTAYAAIILGISGTSYQSQAVADVQFQLGSGLDSSSFRYAYVTLNDTLASTYFTNVILFECTSDVASPTAFPGGCTAKAVAMESGSGANMYNVAQTGVGRRLVTFDFVQYCNNYGSCTTSHVTTATTPIVLSPTKFYWIYFISSNSKTSGTPVGSFGVYGIQATLHSSDGTPIEAQGTGGTSIGTIGSPYVYLSDSALTTLDQGFYTPASSSSQSSLSGARQFCTGVASSSVAFGIPYGLCYIGGYLFVPSAESLSMFNNLRQQVSTKIPYSYVVESREIFSDISSSSGTFPSMTVPFTMAGSTSHFTLFSLATIKQYLPTGTLAAFRLLMVAVLWISFAFTVWYKVGNMFKR